MVKMNKETGYKKDLNELKEQILKEGNTLLTKRDLLERFCEIDKEYNDDSWNLLQILANINILIGEKPCEDTHETVSMESYEHEYFLRKEFETKIDKLQRQLEEQTAKAESILNKVRDKIADVADYDAYGDVQQAFNNGLWEAVKIIDKCKLESEDKG